MKQEFDKNCCGVEYEEDDGAAWGRLLALFANSGVELLINYYSYYLNLSMCQ